MAENIIQGKFCKGCGIFRAAEDCYLYKDILRCKECARASARRFQYRKRNGEKLVRVPYSEQRLRTVYGITKEQKQEILAKQNGACAICHNVSDKLHIDHDHITKKVRGLLCNRCNIGIGFFKDNIGLLQTALIYLTETK